MAVLDKYDTRAPKDLEKQKTKEDTSKLLKQLNDLQNRLWANAKQSVLVVLQGIDASGKDGVINNVFGALSLQGVAVHAFKVPTEEEKAHDFLWRVHQNAPPKRMIGVFNRSHYEDVLITRVHGWCDDETAKRRFKAINDFEQLLSDHNNTIILKFYLHISKDEQEERLKERKEMPNKAWKYNAGDLEERKLWDKYMEMYEEVFANCSAIPWTIVPADQNWYKEYLVAKTVVKALEELNMQYPLPKLEADASS